MKGTFKILQFNMQFGQIWDDAYPDRAPIRLDQTIEEIRSHDADIVLLQEVEHAQPGGVQAPVPPNYSKLRQALSAYDSFFSYPKADPRELPFGIGLAIFSKTPLRDTMRLDLPSPPVAFDFFGETKTPTDRVLIGAKTLLFGRELQILNTHLLAFFMLHSSSEEHIEQRTMVANLLKSCSGPAVLGGDFNTSNHDSLVRQFGDVGYRTVQTTEITWRRRPYVLDHIFYNAHLRPVAHKIKPTLASDHHVLVADFAFA
ncbi:MAG: endonuclease/exonuclease/phosphatase family protein [Opitutaceae bacterium]|nr:endonuclease/exonuclease/phosphatase family protein [Opitutaceae bacterium]